MRSLTYLHTSNNIKMSIIYITCDENIYILRKIECNPHAFMPNKAQHLPLNTTTHLYNVIDAKVQFQPRMKLHLCLCVLVLRLASVSVSAAQCMQ